MAWGERIKPRILLNQNDDVNFDGHVVVRGVLVSRSKITQLEDEIGGKLIPDEKHNLLKVLDELAELIRRNNRGRHTRERTIEFQNERYVHRDLIVTEGVMNLQWEMNFKLDKSVNLGGMKKMWFQKPINLQVNRSKGILF